jgi:hypothetical protein
MTIALTGNDSIIIDGLPLVDLANGDVGTLTFPNDITSATTGKNGNSIIALNETGKIAELSIRVLRGSSDDKTLNSKFKTMEADLPSFTLLTGSIVKRIGDGISNVVEDTYALSGGTFSKRVETTSNVEGDIEQGVSVYNIRFTNSSRNL